MKLQSGQSSSRTPLRGQWLRKADTRHQVSARPRESLVMSKKTLEPNTNSNGLSWHNGLNSALNFISPTIPCLLWNVAACTTCRQFHYQETQSLKARKRIFCAYYGLKQRENGLSYVENRDITDIEHLRMCTSLTESPKMAVLAL